MEYATDFTASQIAKGDPEGLLDWQRRWPNFSPSELACRCCGNLRVHHKAMDTLQALRTTWRRPIRLNSAFRCANWNKRVSGAIESLHLTGRAFDISLVTAGEAQEGAHTASLIFHATKAGFNGFGLYPHFLHVDIGRHRTWQQGDTRLDVQDDTSELGYN